MWTLKNDTSEPLTVVVDGKDVPNKSIMSFEGSAIKISLTNYINRTDIEGQTNELDFGYYLDSSDLSDSLKNYVLSARFYPINNNLYCTFTIQSETKLITVSINDGNHTCTWIAKT